MIETNLVDFNSLDRDPTSGRRDELMRSVASLFSVTSEGCTLEQIEIYDQVLSRLADMVETEARAFAAAKIAPLRRAPEQTIRRFARDEIRVARPVLSHSPMLTDVDLLDIIHSRGADHLHAISGRKVLSEEVTSAAVEKGDAGIRRRIAGNHGAALSEAAMQILLDQARGDAEVASALGERADTPDTVIAELVDKASEEVRRTLREKGYGLDKARIASATRVAEERMSNSYWLGLYDFESAWARLAKAGGVQAASESLICRFAAEDRFPEAAAAFAMLTDISLEEAKHWLVRTDTEPFLMVAKACGFRVQTVQALLKVGPWKHRLTAQSRTQSLNAFMAMDQRMARERVALYLQTRRTA